MAKSITDIKQELGITSSSTIDNLFTLASQYKVFSQAEINNIKAISVLPLANSVKDKADELKQRFTDIVLNENKGQIHGINVRIVIILELLEKLNTLAETLSEDKADKADVADNLTTNDSDKVLSAKQGYVLKGMLDTMQAELDSVEALENLNNIVGTYSELEALITIGEATEYQLNAKVQVLNDSTHGGNSTLYNLDSLDIENGLVDNYTWRFVGYYDGYNKEQIDEIINDFEQSVIDNFNELSGQLEGALTEQDEKIESLGTLQPSGADTTANITSKTSPDGIWISTTDGHWYYWNGTQYVDGGVYQAVEISDNSTGIEKIKFQNMLIGDGNINKTNYDNIGLASNTKYYNHSHYKTLNNIYIGTNFIIKVDIPSGYKLAVAYNDVSEANYIRIYSYSVPADNTYSFTAIANKYYSFSLGKTDGTEFDGSETYYININVTKNINGKYILDRTLSFNSLDLEQTSNLFNKNDVVSGYLDLPTNILPSDTYKTSNYIYVRNGVSIYIPRLRKFAFYDINKVSVTFISNTQNDYIFTPNQDGYIRFSLWSSDLDNMYVTTNTSDPHYEIYGIYLPDDVLISGEQINLIETTILNDIKLSVLDGRNWYAYGDSFTEGDFSGIEDETLYKFQEGRYSGYKKVYPYWIGNRTMCNIYNNAHSGDTLTTDFVGSELYKNIPSNADIITLYYGINDSHQNIPIGTINDNTDDTFYGAWNIAIQWILENRPNAKLGVIISNGCDSIDYPVATINICKKWGLSYLDINGDETLPMVIRTNMRSNLSTQAWNYWYNKYKVSNTNGHPNVKAHEDESYMIQQWLERL